MMSPLSVRGALVAVGDGEFSFEFGDLVSQAAVLGEQRGVALTELRLASTLGVGHARSGGRVAGAKALDLGAYLGLFVEPLARDACAAGDGLEADRLGMSGEGIPDGRRSSIRSTHVGLHARTKVPCPGSRERYDHAPDDSAASNDGPYHNRGSGGQASNAIRKARELSRDPREVPTQELRKGLALHR